MVHWCYALIMPISPTGLAMPTFAIVGTCIALVYLSEAQGQTHYYIGITMTTYDQTNQDNQDYKETWFTAHYEAKQAMQDRADTMGALIIDDKNTKFHNEHHFIVLAKYRHDFVTWVWANGGFHNGHYYHDDAKGAQADFIKRGE